MSTLYENSQSAERERGCVWAENFVNAEAVVENGGAITGTPSFDNGVVLDGTNDYITYGVPASTLNTIGFGCVIKFNPTFDPSDNVTRYFYNWNPGTESSLYFVSSTLYLRQGQVVTGSIPYATYGSLWNTNGENVIVVASTTGDNSIWLNGTKILDSNGQAWPFNAPTEIFIGSNAGGSKNFAGTIKSIKFFTTQLTDQEALDYSNGGGFWNYLNETELNLPMNLENHDPTNTRTLDVSGNGNSPTYTVGATAPTKETNIKGYSFDGGDFLTFGDLAALEFTSGDFTLSCWIRLDNDLDGSAVTNYELFSSETYLDQGWLIRVQNGSAAAAGKLYFRTSQSGTFSDSETSVRAVYGRKKQHIVVIKRDSKVRFYVNGIQIISDGDPITSPTAGSNDKQVGGRSSQKMQGVISDFIVWSSALSPIQIKDLYFRGLRQINDI